MVSAKLENVQQGGRPGNQNAAKNEDANLHVRFDDITRARAAELLNVSPRSVASAKKVLNKADESIVDAIEMR
jgi:hypothetical protein